MALLFASIVLAACGDRAASTDARVEVDTIGDTIVVRTLGVGVWGDSVALVEEVSIGELERDEPYIFGRITSVAEAPDGGVYVLDGQAPIIRKYDAAGVHVRDVGGVGGGPGEYRRPNGMDVLPDGRLLVYDPSAARVNVYGPGGEPLTTWPVPGGLFGSHMIDSDTAGRTYVSIVTERTADGFETGKLRLTSGGAVIDTVPIPESPVESPVVRVRRETERGGVSATFSVPFAPSSGTVYSPLGYFVVTGGAPYAVDLMREDGVLRIAREINPVRVDPEEKEFRISSAETSMRRMVPDWKWDGPAIPDVKAPIKSLHAASDGRIWVEIAQSGVRVANDEEREPSEGSAPTFSWREPAVYDVFEPDGTYLGLVRLPDRSMWAAASDNHVWAITRDDLGVQRVVKYRIQPAAQ